MTILTRFQLWSCHAIDHRDEIQLPGTYSEQSAKRLLQFHYLNQDSTRLLVARPVQIRVVGHHAWWMRMTWRSGRLSFRNVVAADIARATKAVAAYSDIEQIDVWFCSEDYRAGAPPLRQAIRQGRSIVLEAAK